MNAHYGYREWFKLMFKSLVNAGYLLRTGCHVVWVLNAIDIAGLTLHYRYRCGSREFGCSGEVNL